MSTSSEGCGLPNVEKHNDGGDRSSRKRKKRRRS